ncbi:WYL domain-containing protein [Staphylococcus sp. GDX8P102P-2]|uniref:helix-turn-helix transcriptional regulator n=1 Tax=Staphylococcus sp. GDX8P102P-2 TaxID=2804106 RepID=UPI001AEBCB2E|nr:WYL domain-containing protein [Staphylococcus sp. GDX8P102P-2]
MAKSTEILELYLKFMNGEKISKKEISIFFDNKSPRTIQRYISNLNEFFLNHEETEHLIINYDAKHNYYYMFNSGNMGFDKKQILVILKILISTRGLKEEELYNIFENLSSKLSDIDKQIFTKTIQSELYQYVSMNHGELLLDKIWDINNLIINDKTITFEYYNALNKGRQHTIKPMYITYSELYFYLVGVNEKGTVLIFRLDRIQSYSDIVKKIKLPQSPYYKEGELKKRIYFMYGGYWKRVRFEFNGGIIESVLDRFPTAKLLKKDYKNNQFEVEIEVIGDGVIMWLLSQGSKVKILSPQSIKKQYIEEIKKITRLYE